MRVLAISFGFPPVIAPRSIQVARLLAHLDLPCAVVCGLEESEPVDPTIEPAAHRALAVVVRVPLARPAWRRRMDGAAMRLGVPWYNRVPDRYRRWARGALIAAHRLIRSDFRPDVLATFGQPMTDHLVGLRLARYYGLPWVAHFSDPWTRNPFHRRTRIDRWMNARLERVVMVSADRLLFPSAECADYVLRGMPASVRSKADVLPHCHADMTGHATPDEPGPLVIRHIGELYGPRSAAPVLQGLELVARRNPAMLRDVRLEFVGVRDPATFCAQDSTGTLHARPRVPYRESLDLMRSADGLLVLDGAWAGPGIFFPSKLADYIGAGRPVMGVTSPGAAARLITSLGGVVAPPDDIAALADGLEQFVRELRARRRQPPAVWGNPGVRASLTAPEVARAFRHQLEMATTHRRT